MSWLQLELALPSPATDPAWWEQRTWAIEHGEDEQALLAEGLFDNQGDDE